MKDGDTVTVAADGRKAQVTARVDGRAPEGVALMPESLGPGVPARAVKVSISK